MKSDKDNAVEAVAIIKPYEGRLSDLAAQSRFWSTSMLYRVLRGHQVEVDVEALKDLEQADGVVRSREPQPEFRMSKTGLPVKHNEVVDLPTIGDTVIDDETGLCGWCVDPYLTCVARFVLEDGSPISVRETCTADGLYRVHGGCERDGYGLLPVCPLPQGRRVWRLTRDWRKL